MRYILATIGAVVRLLRLTTAAALSLGLTAALAQDAHPLKPPDRSSPRATLTTFLESGDGVATFAAREYLPSPSYARFQRLVALGNIPQQCMDLSEVAPAARAKTGRAAATALYEVLSRIPLPPLDEIPDASQVNLPAGKEPVRWEIPNTEIVLVRVSSGPQAGDFLFDAGTVARADEFYERVRNLPYLRPVPIDNLRDVFVTGGGWMLPRAWIEALPDFMRAPIADQALWKWIGLAVTLVVYGVYLWLAYRVSQLGSEQHPFRKALAQFALPTSILIATPAVAYFALVQLNLIGTVAAAVQLAAAAIEFLAAAWMAWRLAPVVAEAIIASPRIPRESIDAHLIRVSARLMGIVGSFGLLAFGADRLGVPVYGIAAGLGVGGLAVALAAQPTIENLLGGMSLFADKPVRVGEVCKYGDATGTIEAIGIRSARIRGEDRTLTTIPNAALAKMPIVNLSQRDRLLIQTVIGLRYETSPEQLRYVLVKLRELLLGHPRVDSDSIRVRFIGFGASSLDVQVTGYVMTTDPVEFAAIREDLLLRVMDIVAQAGTAFALPSQTVYLGRDQGSDESKVPSDLQPD